MGLVLSKTTEIMAHDVIFARRKTLETLAENLGSAYIWSSVCEDFKEAADLDRQALTVGARLKAHYRADSVVFADADGNIRTDSEYGPSSDYSVETLVAELTKYHDDLDASVQWDIVGGPERDLLTGPTDLDIALKEAEIAEVEDIIALYSDPAAARLAYDLLAEPGARVQWREGDPDIADRDIPTLYDKVASKKPADPIEGDDASTAEVDAEDPAE